MNMSASDLCWHC